MQRQKQLVKVGDTIICKKTIYFDEIWHPELYEKWRHRLYLKFFAKPMFKDGEKYEISDVKEEYIGPTGCLASWVPNDDYCSFIIYLYRIKNHPYHYEYKQFINSHIENIFHTPREIRRNKLKKLNNEAFTKRRIELFNTITIYPTDRKYFSDYFYTEKDIRKLKLKKLNGKA